MRPLDSTCSGALEFIWPSGYILGNAKTRNERVKRKQMGTLLLERDRTEARGSSRAAGLGGAVHKRDQGSRPSRYADHMRWFLMGNFAVVVAMVVLVTLQTRV